MKLNKKKIKFALFLLTLNCPNVTVSSEILPHIDTAYWRVAPLGGGRMAPLGGWRAVFFDNEVGEIAQFR